MKIIALMGAGLLAAGSFAAVPADAQRHGWHGGHGYGYGYGGGYRGYRGGYRGYRGGHGFRGGRRYRGGYGWNRGPRWGGRYGRVVCRGPYGRRCTRVYR